MATREPADLQRGSLPVRLRGLFHRLFTFPLAPCSRPHQRPDNAATSNPRRSTPIACMMDQKTTAQPDCWRTNSRSSGHSFAHGECRFRSSSAARRRFAASCRCAASYQGRFRPDSSDRRPDSRASSAAAAMGSDKHPKNRHHDAEFHRSHHNASANRFPSARIRSSTSQPS